MTTSFIPIKYQRTENFKTSTKGISETKFEFDRNRNDEF